MIDRLCEALTSFKAAFCKWSPAIFDRHLSLSPDEAQEDAPRPERRPGTEAHEDAPIHRGTYTDTAITKSLLRQPSATIPAVCLQSLQRTCCSTSAYQSHGKIVSAFLPAHEWFS